LQSSKNQKFSSPTPWLLKQGKHLFSPKAKAAVNGWYIMGYVVRRAATSIIDGTILEGLINLLRKTFHGQVVIITQNYKVVQVERKENFNPEELLVPELSLEETGFKPQAVREKIKQALKGLEFGQVVLVIKKGRLIQIERHLKERFTDLQGLGGDGI
jgi:hypothetical protein